MAVTSDSPEFQTTRPPSDKRLLTAIKLVLALLLLGFLIVGDNDKTWPLVTWPMFDRSGAKMPKSISSLHVRAISADGQSFDFTADSLARTLPVSAVESIIEKTFDDDLDAAKRQDAQAHLAEVVQSKLPGVEITEIQGWDMTWTVNPDAPLDVDPDAPSDQTLLGQFRPANTGAES